MEHNIFRHEIVPIEVKGKVLSLDDTIRSNVSIESLASLKPVFPNWGEASTTAGNASGVGDGAAICVMTTRDLAEKAGMEPIAKWVGSTVVGKSLPVDDLSPMRIANLSCIRCRAETHGNCTCGCHPETPLSARLVKGGY